MPPSRAYSIWAAPSGSKDRSPRMRRPMLCCSTRVRNEDGPRALGRANDATHVAHLFPQVGFPPQVSPYLTHQLDGAAAAAPAAEKGIVALATAAIATKMRMSRSICARTPGRT